MILTGFRISHLFDIAMIRGHNQFAIHRLNGLHDNAQASINRLNSGHRGLHAAGVPYHVGISHITYDDIKFAAAYRGVETF